MKHRILFIILTIYSLSVYAGSTEGTWKDYLSFINVHSVAQVNERIYAASEIGLFYYDTTENAFQKLTKINGLSDVEVSAISAVPNSNKLIVGYKNGNIDIVEGASVTNIPDLYLSNVVVDKSINHFYFYNNKAYLSTEIGIIVLDYQKNEITDTYLLGENSTYLAVNQISILNDSIFAATENGLLGAPINSNMLFYYQTWSLSSNDRDEYISVVTNNQSLVFAKRNGTTGYLFQLKSGELTELQQHTNLISLAVYQNKTFVVSSNTLFVYDEDFHLEKEIYSSSIENTLQTPSFSSILIDENNTEWIGDFNNGLIEVGNMANHIIVPDGPCSNRAYRMATSENSLWVVGGVNHFPSPKFYKAELSILRNNKWTNLNSSNNKYFKVTYNLNDIAIDPRNDLHGYVSSQHSGIYEIRNDSIVTHFTDKNNNCPMDSAYVWRIVNGVVMDDDGNLFANNMGDSIPIIVKPDVITDDSKANNYGWYQYNYASYGSDSDPWLWQTIITQSKHFWSVSTRNPESLFVYDIAGTIETDADDSYRYGGTSNNSNCSTLPNNGQLLIWDENGMALDITPICLAEDQNGHIWVGTNSGIVVYHRPWEIFTIDKPVASRIKIPRNDGSGLTDNLLENEEISCIAVDANNKKWIGTYNEGVYLVSSDGTQTIHEFNSKNSPLLSNYILSIAINPKSGEVFFGTDKGIVSYKEETSTDITENNTIENTGIFPNPTNGIVNINLGNQNEKITMVNVLNMAGQKLLSKHVDNQKLIQIDLSLMNNGIYLVELVCDHKSSVYKVLKQ